ncbi:MAG TPA: PA14 domain-containing protein [Candidatus Limnocylindrales bacterium]|nr:PA14 domain-containing protein [Candidatus Limnocylindrales bacterium]
MPSAYTLAVAGCLSLSLARAQAPALRDAPITTFGVTVYDSSGLRGEVYLIPPESPALPKFEKLKPVGTIYASALNVAPTDYQETLQPLTKRFEWFAIDYTGNFYISDPGKYRFLIASDDGSKLYIDDKLIIDNDGLHILKPEEGKLTLKGGIHRIRVSYFQGPCCGMALILAVARPGEDWRLFSTREFGPPRTPAEWKYGAPDKK